GSAGPVGSAAQVEARAGVYGLPGRSAKARDRKVVRVRLPRFPLSAPVVKRTKVHAGADLRDAVAVEDALQGGLAERIDVVLQDDRLAFEVLDLRVDPRPVRSGGEERRVGGRELVADVDHEVAGGAGGGQDLRRVVRRRLDPAQYPFGRSAWRKR